MAVKVDQEQVPSLSPKDLENKAFFGRNRNYFIQLVQAGETDAPMPPLYFQLKRLARKKSQPLFPYRLHLAEFGEHMPTLAKAFNLGPEEL
jgi:hypothetical protein